LKPNAPGLRRARAFDPTPIEHMPPDRFRVSLRDCLIAGVATEAAYLSLYAVHAGPPSTLAFIVVQTIAWCLFGFLVWRGARGSGSSVAAPVWVIIGAAVLFRLTLVPHDPIASDDVYRYVWDGRVALHGFNPFAHAPNDPQLAALATDRLPSLVNHPDLKSVYPAVAQLFFLTSNVFFGPSVTGYKALLMLAEGLTLFLLVRYLKQKALPPALVMLYAWSPMAIMYGGLDGHIDLLGIPFLLLTITLWNGGRTFRAGFALGAAALVKLHPVLTSLFLAVRGKGWKGWLTAIVPPLVFAAGIGAYDEPTHGFFGAMSFMGSRWEFNSPLFTVAYPLVGTNEGTHLVCEAALLGWLMWTTLRAASIEEKMFLAFLGFVLLGPVAHPWYFLWVAVLTVVYWSPVTLVLLAMTNLSNVVVYRYHSTGEWVDDPLLVAVEYAVPLLVALTVWRVRSRDGGSRRTVQDP
jgi:alpha-1,6-mannosyltransferase